MNAASAASALAPGWPALLVEAFAEQPCQGNGAAVVLLDRPVADRWLQALARSLNQSETAFLLPLEGHWLLRWFTPSCEVPLCGHATLAATLALGHWSHLHPGQSLALHSRSGPLPVSLQAPAVAAIVLPSGGLIAAEASAELQAYLQQHLGWRAEATWSSALGYRVVLLPEQAPLAEATLPAAALPAAEHPGLVLMQSLSAGSGLEVLEQPCHYQLRFLAPGLGIPEDPVTGSAHALVAPWWLEQLGLPQVVGWQCSDRPGGMLCAPESSGMIRLCGAGQLLWDGTLRPGAIACAASAWEPGDLDAECWRGLLP
jgi:predicted PhzF superfamily epimerase YddE/YHI9